MLIHLRTFIFIVYIHKYHTLASLHLFVTTVRVLYICLGFSVGVSGVRVNCNNGHSIFLEYGIQSIVPFANNSFKC